MYIIFPKLLLFTQRMQLKLWIGISFSGFVIFIDTLLFLVIVYMLFYIFLSIANSRIRNIQPGSREVLQQYLKWTSRTPRIRTTIGRHFWWIAFWLIDWLKFEPTTPCAVVWRPLEPLGQPCRHILTYTIYLPYSLPITIKKLSNTEIIFQIGLVLPEISAFYQTKQINKQTLAFLL